MRAGLDQLDHLLTLPYESYLDASAQAHEAEITDLNRQQLDRGLDSSGRDLGIYKNFAYKNRWEPVDLLDTGAFRSSFRIDPQTGGFVMEAGDSKSEELQDKYGDDILGVPVNDYDVVAELLTDDLIDNIRKAL